MFGFGKKPADPQAPKVMRGTDKACGCPHCGKANSFEDIHEMLEAGNWFKCDHCEGLMEIVQVRKTTLLWLRQKR